MPLSSNSDALESYYLGLDEGQTATRVVVLTSEGYVRGISTGPPGNIARHTTEEILARWCNVVDSTLEQAKVSKSQIVSAGFGLSSFVWPSDLPFLERLVEKVGLPCSHIIFDDCMMVLRAGLPKGIGVALLAGSGSGVIGRNVKGDVFRSFNNSRLGDGGGSWTLIERVMERIACSYFGIFPETDLTKEFLNESSFGDVPELLEHYIKNTIEYQKPRYMQIIFEAYAQNDRAARSVIQYMAHRYVDVITAVARKLHLEEGPFDLVLSGGLFKASSSPLSDLVKHYIHKKSIKARVIPLRGAPVIGAAIAAIDFNRFRVPEEVYLNVSSSLNESGCEL